MSADRLFANRGVSFGWILNMVGTLCIATLSSVMYSFGVFFDPLLESFQASNQAISLVFSTNQFMVYMFAAGVGFLVDSWNSRLLIGFGALCTLGGLAGAAVVGSYAGVLVLYGFVLAVGFGAIYVTVYATIARWFDERRGTAMGLLSVGFGIGAFAGPPIADTLLQWYSWETTYLIAAVVLGGLFVVAAFLFRDDPSAIGACPDGRSPSDSGHESLKRSPTERITVLDAISSDRFWFVTLGFLFSNYAFFTLIVHFVPYAESVGMSGTVAAAALGFVGAASIPSRFGAGYASDRVGRIPILVASIGLMAVSLIGIVLVSDPLVIVVFAIVFGVGNGGQNALYSPIVADLFSIENVGRMIGMTTVAFAVAGSAGPYVTSVLFRTTGSYLVPFVVASVVALIGAATITMSRV